MWFDVTVLQRYLRSHFLQIAQLTIIFNQLTSMSQTTSQHQEVNPLQKKLSPEQFQASVKFYEADNKLTSQDREEISKDLELVVGASYLAGYGAGMGTFFGPTVWAQVQARKSGLKPKFSVSKPFFSTFLGLSAVIAAHQLVSKYKFSNKVQELEAGAAKPEQLQVWRCMDYHQSSLFFLYYKQSSKDPLFILKDPRLYHEHEVTVHPPAKSPWSVGLDQHFGSALGMGSRGSHWQEIRKENGFEMKNTNEEQANREGNNNIINDDGIDDINGSSDQDRSEPKSAWDRIRGQK